MQNNNDYQNFKIGSLWLKTSKDGKTKYMQGNIDLYGAKINISIFKNTKKEKDKQPDYYISTYSAFIFGATAYESYQR